MNGTSQDTFSPLSPIIRGQFVTVLYKLEKATNITYDENRFGDVKANDFFALPVMWAADNNITGGVDQNLFSPNMNITREQMAVMLYKYAGIKNY